MTGGPVQDSMIGVGPALRKARERRGITLDAASRDTKIHIDQLRALESESFGALIGDVYVRGSLRTYARYLGLSPEKVIGAYAEHSDEPEPPPPPAKLGRVERAIAATRIRDNQRLMVVLAGVVLVFAIVFGFLSRGHSVPPPAKLPTAAAQPAPLDREIDAVIEAVSAVDIIVVADGLESTYAMEAGETRSFTAQSELVLRASDGGALRVTVNGVGLGIAGPPGQPWTDTFSFDSSGGATPSNEA
jgi:cytoskeleton protein RodZ